jgi:hypothetical protein
MATCNAGNLCSVRHCRFWHPSDHEPFPRHLPREGFFEPSWNPRVESELAAFRSAGILLWRRRNERIECFLAIETRDGEQELGFIGGKRLYQTRNVEDYERYKIYDINESAGEAAAREFEEETCGVFENAVSAAAPGRALFYLAPSKYVLFIAEVKDSVESTDSFVSETNFAIQEARAEAKRVELDAVAWVPIDDILEARNRRGGYFDNNVQLGGDQQNIRVSQMIRDEYNDGIDVFEELLRQYQP